MSFLACIKATSARSVVTFRFQTRCLLAFFYKRMRVLLFPIQDNERSKPALSPLLTFNSSQLTEALAISSAESLRLKRWNTWECADCFFDVLQCTASCAVAAYQPQTSQTTHLQKCKHSIFSTHSVSKKEKNLPLGLGNSYRSALWKIHPEKHLWQNTALKTAIETHIIMELAMNHAKLQRVALITR